MLLLPSADPAADRNLIRQVGSAGLEHQGLLGGGSGPAATLAIVRPVARSRAFSPNLPQTPLEKDPH
jgi:hypothetical protein